MLLILNECCKIKRKCYIINISYNVKILPLQAIKNDLMNHDSFNDEQRKITNKYNEQNVD